MAGDECIVDPETFFYMAPSGQLHAHIYDNATGVSRCVLTNTCEVCGEAVAACECMGPRTCPRCGSPDLREIVVDEDLEHVDLACIDCSWRQRIGGTP